MIRLCMYVYQVYCRVDNNDSWYIYINISQEPQVKQSEMSFWQTSSFLNPTFFNALMHGFTDSGRSLGTARPGFIDTAFQRPSMNHINPSVGVKQSRWQEAAWGGWCVRNHGREKFLFAAFSSAIVSIPSSDTVRSHCSCASFNMIQHLGLISPMLVDLGGASSAFLGFP